MQNTSWQVEILSCVEENVQWAWAHFTNYLVDLLRIHLQITNKSVIFILWKVMQLENVTLKVALLK